MTKDDKEEIEDKKNKSFNNRKKIGRVREEKEVTDHPQ